MHSLYTRLGDERDEFSGSATMHRTNSGMAAATDELRPEWGIETCSGPPQSTTRRDKRPSVTAS
jgi:hypothetical protein